jgi:hypothetical protein
MGICITWEIKSGGWDGPSGISDTVLESLLRAFTVESVYLPEIIHVSSQALV